MLVCIDGRAFEKRTYVDTSNCQSNNCGNQLESLSLPGGHVMGLVEPSGAGKTALLKTILDLDRTADCITCLAAPGQPHSSS